MASKSKIQSLDRIFSKYIRERDRQGDFFVCCSCGQTKPFEQADAGHFINRKWMGTRWREDNVHAQCRACNRFDEGNAVGYARFMDKTYGSSHVDMLMALKQQSQKFTDFDLDILIEEYKKKYKSLTQSA